MQHRGHVTPRCPCLWQACQHLKLRFLIRLIFGERSTNRLSPPDSFSLIARLAGVLACWLIHLIRYQLKTFNSFLLLSTASGALLQRSQWVISFIIPGVVQDAHYRIRYLHPMDHSIDRDTESSSADSHRQTETHRLNKADFKHCNTINTLS